MPADEIQNKPMSREKNVFVRLSLVQLVPKFVSTLLELKRTSNNKYNSQRFRLYSTQRS
jgi:hypothetical protein